MVAWLLAAEPVRELAKEDKARLLIAFLATLGLSALLLLTVWACARLIRRYMNPRREPVSTPLADDDLWRMQPNREELPGGDPAGPETRGDS